MVAVAVAGTARVCETLPAAAPEVSPQACHLQLKPSSSRDEKNPSGAQRLC